MKPALLFLAALGFAGCAQYATVSEIKPKRTGFEAKAGEPIVSLGRYVEAAEAAWQDLERNSGNIEARRDYNFAVGRIFGTLRAARLAPWKQPLRIGASGERTLARKSDPRREWNIGSLIELLRSGARFWFRVPAHVRTSAEISA